MLKRMAAMLTAVCLLMGCAYAEELGGEQSTLSATGTALISQTQTGALLRFDLSAEGDTMEATNQRMNASIESLKEILSGMSVPESLIRTKEANIQATSEYHYTKITEKVTLNGFAASQTIEVFIEDAEKADEVIQALHHSGFSSNYDIQYVSYSNEEALDAALAQAAKEAVRKAETLAQALGLDLGPMSGLEETTNEQTVCVTVTYALP